MLGRVLLLMSFAVLGSAVKGRAGDAYAPGELIIKYRPTAVYARRLSLDTSIRASVGRHFDLIDADVLTLDPSVTVEQALSTLRGNPDVEYAEPNYRIDALATPNDPQFPQQWDLKNTGQTGGVPGADIRASQAWDLFTGDPNLKIGVIDSGVDYLHPDLVDNIWTNPGEVPGNNIDDDGNGYVDDVHGYDFVNFDSDPMDDTGHGTHVAGTIAARGNNGIGIAGICWSAKIVAIKCLGPSGGFTSNAIAAIQYAVANGIRITNNSWGGSMGSQALEAAIAAAGDAGQIFVAAAGNASSDDAVNPTYPAGYDLSNIISVAAINSSDQLSSFSNFGLVSVDLGAPGEGIVSTLYHAGYAAASGTSMAAPHVTGAMALLLGRHPELTVAQAKARLLSTVIPIPSLAGRTVTGGRLNALCSDAASDVVPPSAVGDLAAGSASSNSLTLTWHAPGDDGTAGTAERYELRHSTAPITAANFTFATLFEIAAPVPAGQPQSLVVPGLSFTTTYYFALRTFDDVANVSPLSNVAVGTTLGAPSATLTPVSLSAALPTGGQATQSLELRNVGQGTLDYTLESGAFATNGVVRAPYPSEVLAKGVVNPQPAIGALASRGGPDAYGNRWIDSDDPNGPEYSWVDITATGTPLTLSGDDVLSEVVPIGFPFRFYDGIFNELRVCSNGWISFSSDANFYFNQPLPNAGAPENMIAPFWADLIVPPQSVFVSREPGRTIIEFKDAQGYGGGGSITFEMMLFVDGRARFQYQMVPTRAPTATVGIQNALRNDGLTVAFNAPYAKSGLAVEIKPPRAWLSATPRSGRVLAGQVQSIVVGIDATGQFGGTYDENIIVASNDPQNPHLAVPVHLEVAGVPILTVDRSTLGFGALLLGASAQDSMSVSNTGSEALVVTSIVPSNPEVTVTPSSLSLGVLQSRRVYVTYHPLTTGVPGTLALHSSDPAQPLLTVTLTGEGSPPPVAGVAPSALTLPVAAQGRAVGTLQLSNAGEGPLYFRVRPLPVGNPWLSVAPDTGRVPAHGLLDLVVTVDAATLLGGQYDAALRITTNDPLRPSLPDVSIRASVTGIPDVAFSGAVINFGPVYITQSRTYSVGVVNHGTGPLTVSGVETSASVFGAAAVGFSLAPGATHPVAVTFTPDAVGAIAGTFTVHSDDPDSPNATLPLTAAGLPGPDLRTDPGSLHSTLAPEMTDPRTVTLSNVGAKTVTWNATVSLDLDGGPAPAIVAPGWFTNAARQEATDAPPIQGGSGLADSIGDVLAALGGPHVSFSDDAEHGTSAWSVQGDRYWHLTTRVWNSPTRSWWCGLDGPATYSNGSRVHASIVSSLIDLTTWGPPVSLSFAEIYETEPGWDECRVDVSSDGGGTWTNVRAGAWGTSGGWKLTTIDLPVQTGSQVRVRFDFDTHDGFANDFPGWFIDDVLVTSRPRQWLLLDARTGTLPPSANVVLHPVFSSAGMVGGEYSGSVQFQTAGSLNAPVQLAVGLRVLGVPNLVVSSTAVSLATAVVGTTVVDTTLHVSNDGTDWLNITQFELQSGPISSDLNTLTLGPGEIRAIPLRFSPVTTGPLAAILTLYSNDPDQPLTRVTLLATSLAAPVISLAPESLYIETASTVVATRFVDISNTGGSPLSWTSTVRPVPGESTTPAWLHVTPSASVIASGATRRITVSADPTGLVPESHRAIIRVSSNDPARSSVDFAVEMFLPADAQLTARDSALEFGKVHVGQMSAILIQASNTGSRIVQVEAVAIAPGPFTVVGAAGPLAPGESLTIIVTFSPAEPGDWVRALTILSSDPMHREIKISVHGSATTPPKLAAEPADFDVVVRAGQTLTRQLSLTNLGGDDLHYQVELLENGHFSITGPPIAFSGSAGKSHSLAAVGAPEHNTAGGTDLFGHRWIDSDTQGGPTYQWIELVGTGTPVALTGDRELSGPLPIGFEFPFYDKRFTQFSVSTDGWISFTATRANDDVRPLPSGYAPENLLAVYWANLFAPAGSVLYRQDADRLVVEFNGLTNPSSTGSYSFEAILEPSGRIMMQYKLLSGGASYVTVGLQDAYHYDALMIGGASSVHNGLAIQIDSPRPWMATPATTDTIVPGGHVEFPITFDAVGREQSGYHGQVQIISDDPTNAYFRIPVSLAIVSEPNIVADPLDLGDVPLGGIVTGQVLVRNTGDRPLHVIDGDLEGDGFELVSPPFPLTIAPGSSAGIALRFVSTGACDPCPGTLSLYSDDPDQGYYTIALHARSLPDPALSVTQTAVSARLAPAIGAFAEHTGRPLSVTNTGGFPLHVSATVAADWLKVAPGALTVTGGATAVFAITFDAHGMPDGPSAAAVVLTSDDPARPVVSVPCSLQVGALMAGLNAVLDRVDRNGAGRLIWAGISLPEGRDPHELLASSLRLAGLSPDLSKAPRFQGNEVRYAFDRLALLPLLSDGEAVPLALSGRLIDSTWVAAIAGVHVARPVMSTTLGPVLAAGTSLALMWTPPADPHVLAYDLWYSSDDAVTERVVTLGSSDAAWNWTVPRPATANGRLELVARDAVGEIGWWLSDALEVTGATTGISDGPPVAFGLRVVGNSPTAGHAAAELVVPSRMNVSVDVFDLRGRRVRQLARGESGPGRSLLRWDGRDDDGLPVSAGIYFVRADAGAPLTATARWVLLR